MSDGLAKVQRPGVLKGGKSSRLPGPLWSIEKVQIPVQWRQGCNIVVLVRIKSKGWRGSWQKLGLDLGANNERESRRITFEDQNGSIPNHTFAVADTVHSITKKKQ